MNENIELIIDDILHSAKVFLIELGEFAPFGSAVTKDEKISPLAVFLDEDHPSSLKMIETLEDHINKLLISGDYLVGAIAIDVMIRIKGEKFNAVEIRVLDKEEHSINGLDTKLIRKKWNLLK